MLYPNLIKAMKDEGVTKTDLANLLGLHLIQLQQSWKGKQHQIRLYIRLDLHLLKQ